MTVEELLETAPTFSSWSLKDKVLSVAYCLIESAECEAVTGEAIAGALRKVDEPIRGNVAQCLRDYANTPKPLFIATNVSGRFRLTRHGKEKAHNLVDSDEIPLAPLVPKLKALAAQLGSPEKSFLEEAVLCLRAGAPRAAIVMVWILAVDHLYRYILTHKLADFNQALQNDKSVKKPTVIRTRDDFSDLKDVKFIELCRVAGIISDDVRKVLDEKRGIRNSAGHPSGVAVAPEKTREFILDLVPNVIQKYVI